MSERISRPSLSALDSSILFMAQKKGALLQCSERLCSFRALARYGIDLYMSKRCTSDLMRSFLMVSIKLDSPDLFRSQPRLKNDQAMNYEFLRKSFSMIFSAFLARAPVDRRTVAIPQRQNNDGQPC